MSQHGDDAQRDLEQRALRNVRGLLDKVEDQERLDRRVTVRLAVISVVAALVLSGLVVAWIKYQQRVAAEAVVSQPAKGPR